MKIVKFAEIPHYCDDNPASLVRHSSVRGTFEQKIGSRAQLACAEEYWPQANGALVAVCTAYTPSAGIWVPNGICACNGKGALSI